jgi:Protein of unknown function DUF262/Protein of unknown function (DUF1524)
MNNVFNIEELFSGRLVIVPDYQRGYAWEKRQWNEFLEDLELLPPKKDHFTGTVVLHAAENGESRIDESGKRYQYFNIVDGQQRLTTIVILLDAIRHRMLDYPKLTALMSGISSTYLYVNDLNGERIHKLTLNRDTHHYFINNVLEDPPGPEGPLIASHQRLRDAKKHFRDYLTRQAAIHTDDDPSWLVDIYDKVTHRLRVSLYTVNDASEVGVIFEVMNNRGKSLSELEKVKNFLLYAGSKLDLPPHSLSDNVNKTWTNIFERLMAADLSSTKEENQLLRMHWLMVYDYRSRNFDGSNSIKSAFQIRKFAGDHKKLLALLQRFTKTLDQASLAYCEIMRPTHSDAFSAFKPTPTLRDAIIHASEKLDRINVVATFLPLLIAIRLRFPEDAQKYLDALRVCEVFAFRVYRLLQRRSDAGQKTIFHVANELFSNELGFDEAIRQLRSELFAYCPNHVFIERFKLNDEENNWYVWGGLKYLLYEYEEHLAKDHTVQMPWRAIAKKPIEQTIEHVLPQTPTDDYWATRFDRAEIRCFLHDLGNLCLTSDNSSYGNKPFSEKKGSAGQGTPCYADSNLFQERELASCNQWTVEAIQTRRNKIVEWALNRWHADDTGVTPMMPDEVNEDVPFESDDE